MQVDQMEKAEGVIAHDRLLALPSVNRPSRPLAPAGQSPALSHSP